MRRREKFWGEKREVTKEGVLVKKKKKGVRSFLVE